MADSRRSLFFLPAAALAFALAAGCGSSNNNNGNNPGGGTPGSGNVTQATQVANGAQFSSPLDAAPSPDGSQIYFIAVDPNSGVGVFKAPAAGGAATAVSTGTNLGAPLGLVSSVDGSKIYVADPAGQTTNDRGGIFSVPSGGGAATLINETADYAPRSVAVGKVGGSENVYFIGDDKTDSTTGIFKDAGGTVTTVLKGSAAGNPAALAVAADGTVYVLDSAGKIGKVAPGGTSLTSLGGASQSLSASFPGGMDLAQDESALLVAGTDPATGKESIARVAISSGAVTQIAAGLTGSEPGGLHRAQNADVYGFVDASAGNGTGTVYLLK